MSPLDTAVFVLFTSFVSHSSTSTIKHESILTGFQTAYQCFHHLEPRSQLPLLLLCVVVPALLSIPISYHVPWIFLSIPVAFSAYGSALVSFTLVYRLSPWHPLAKYPGPAIAKTSKLWGSYLSATGDMHRCFKSLHDRYGDVVRVGKCRPLFRISSHSAKFIGPNELSIRDPSFIHPILGQGGLPKGGRTCVPLSYVSHLKLVVIRLGGS